MTVKSIVPQDLCLIMHSDASFLNAAKNGTQAGYILGFTNREMASGMRSPWSPAAWRSYRLKRVVGSTLAGETQALSDGIGHLEWLLCHLCEALYADFDIKMRERWFGRHPCLAVTDCKSVYDHITGASSPSTVGDRRVAVDMVIVREGLSRSATTLRWAPTDRQLADGLTKDSAEPCDLLRGVIRTGCYQISEESLMLDLAKAERQQRKAT